MAAYAQNVTEEVGTIAHACGVRSPRELRRFHAQVVQPNGLTVGLDALYPKPVPRSAVAPGRLQLADTACREGQPA